MTMQMDQAALAQLQREKSSRVRGYLVIDESKSKRNVFLEKSVFNSTHWIVFENNGPVLWAKIKAQLSGFLTNLFNEGLFAGSSPSDAFFVIVDESNNDANSISAGQVIIDIGVAANTPAEFVRFRFQQITLG